MKQAVEFARELDMHPADFIGVTDLAGFLLMTLRDEAPRGVPSLQQRDLNGRFLIAMENLHARVVAIEAALRRADLGAAARGERPPFAP